mmetsp:Transcript_25060/g.27790  ORF Transcript_25060/g.27790 Transcript_25060/m.27790 type:complete len:132 (+) Transcript_25060:93-488(+)
MKNLAKLKNQKRRMQSIFLRYFHQRYADTKRFTNNYKVKSIESLAIPDTLNNRMPLKGFNQYFRIYSKVIPMVYSYIDVYNVTIRKGHFQVILNNITKLQKLAFEDCLIDSEGVKFTKGGKYCLEELTFKG